MVLVAYQKSAVSLCVLVRPPACVVAMYFKKCFCKKKTIFYPTIYIDVNMKLVFPISMSLKEECCVHVLQKIAKSIVFIISTDNYYL